MLTDFPTYRIVVFSLRAAQARSPSMALNNGLLKYMQVSFGLGFVGIASDMVNLTRCLLVNPTFGPSKWDEAPASVTKECFFEPPKDGDEDRARERFWARRWADFANLAFMASSIPGGVANGQFSRNNWDDEKKANKVFTLRFVLSC